MKIDYAVISADDSYYLEFYEIVSRVWNHFGVKTLMLHITNEETDITQNEFGLYKKVKFMNDYPTSWQAQLVRLYSYKFMENDDVSLLTSDIDMIPLSGDYFHKSAEPLEDEQVLSYTGQAYSCVPYYPMCYMLGKSKTMSHVMGLQDRYEDFIRSIAENYTVKWNADENFLYDSVTRYEKFLTSSHKREFGNDRIDRSHWSYDVDRLRRGEYIDSHMLRPYTEHKRQIDDLVRNLTNKG
jgi:hypothetical protein